MDSWRTLRRLRLLVSSSGNGYTTVPSSYVLFSFLLFSQSTNTSTATQDTGAPITPALIAAYIAESTPSVTKIAGVSAKHAEIASKYLTEEVAKAGRGQYASEFLTSDLMPYLDQAEDKAKL